MDIFWGIPKGDAPLLIAGAGMAGAMDAMITSTADSAMRAVILRCLGEWDAARDAYRAAVGLPPLEKTS
jgi:hypothetical protein